MTRRSGSPVVSRGRTSAGKPGGAIGGGAGIIAMPDIFDPLADIAEEIMEAEGVGRVAADDGALADADVLAVLGIKKIGFGRSDVSAAHEGGAGAGAAGVFPLGFRWQWRNGWYGRRGEPGAESLRVVPAHVHDGPVGIVARRMQWRERTVFADRDRKTTERETVREVGDVMGRLARCQWRIYRRAASPMMNVPGGSST